MLTHTDLFSLTLSVETIVLLSALLIPVLVLLIVYRGRLLSVARCVSRCDVEEVPAALPKVSVIVYSCNDSENLGKMLPSILAQDYPAGFEVIVVNDGASETTKDIVTALMQHHPNLSHTYAPEGSRYLSRKKLSLTIGVKAARYDYVIMTRSSCRVQSSRWLSLMARHFARGKQVVLGYACYSPEDDMRFGARKRAYNALADAATYLSSALAGRPYRGIDANIGYSRELFFKNRGFSKSLNLQYGDDDIFISEIATAENTAVELSADSQVRIVYRRDPRDVYRDIKARYTFTSRFVYGGARRLFGFCSAMAWLWLLLSVGAILSALPNLFALAIVTAVSLCLWLPLMFAWKKLACSLGGRRVFLMLPVRMLLRPLHNLAYRLRAVKGSKWNFTWEKV